MTLSPDIDARAEIQALLDAAPYGGTVDLPAGSFFVTRAGAQYHSIRVPAGVRVRGNGTTIRQAPGTAESVRVFLMDGGGASLENLTGDGDSANQPAGEHRAFAIVLAEDAVLRNVVAQNFRGDGFYVATGGQRALLADCSSLGNTRNGVTFGGSVAGCRIYGGTYAGSAAQQVDTEPAAPGTIDDFTIADAVIDGGASADYALTIDGTGTAIRSRGWRVTGCTINGGINIVWCDDVILAGNAIANGTSKYGIRIYRTNDGITVARNTIAMMNPAQTYASAVYATGTGGASRPTNVNVVDNVITCVAPSSIGLRFDGCGAIAAIGNLMAGSGVVDAQGSAIYARAVDASLPFDLATFVGNVAAGFGLRGIDIRGNGLAQLTRLRAVGNTFGDARAVQSVGISLDDGSHPLQASDLAGNSYGAGVTSGRL